MTPPTLTPLDPADVTAPSRAAVATQPRALATRRRLILALAALPWTGAHAQRAATPDLAQAARLVMDGANALRASQRLAGLETDGQLDRTAAAFATFMAAGDRYGHEADGRTPLQRAQAQGYRHCIVAENIAMVFNSAGYTTEALATQLVEGWSNSSPHRRNLLDAALTQTGVALARSATSGRYYAVQMFGRPESLQLQFGLVNRSADTVSYDIDGATHSLRPNESMGHTVCSAGALVLRLPGEREPRAMQASDGARYALVRQGARWRIDDTR
jgi:uncharacterized protein YkwD